MQYLTLMQQGDSFKIPLMLRQGDVYITPGMGENIGQQLPRQVRVGVGQYRAYWPNGNLLWDSEHEAWLFPFSEQMSYNVGTGAVKIQAQVDMGRGNTLSTPTMEVFVTASLLQGVWGSESFEDEGGGTGGNSNWTVQPIFSPLTLQLGKAKPLIGEAELQAATAIPTKEQQVLLPDDEYDGFYQVTVEPIPDQYQDITVVTATAEQVLQGALFVGSDGELTEGTMPDNGAVEHTLDATEGNQSYTVPLGYHDGTGTIDIVLAEKTATPAAEAQTVTPDEGTVLSSVTVEAIPSDWGNVGSATVTAADLIEGVIAIGKDDDGNAQEITGTMPDNGTLDATIDGITNTEYTLPAGHWDGGTVALTDDIRQRLAAISGSDSATIPTQLEALTQDIGAAYAAAIAKGAEEPAAQTTDNMAATIASIDIGSKIWVENTTLFVLNGEVDGTTAFIHNAGEAPYIPEGYHDTSMVTATAADVLDGKIIVAADGSVVEGSITNHGAADGTIDGMETTIYGLEAGYYSGGEVTLTDSVEQALSEI